MTGTLGREPWQAVLWGRLRWHPAVRAWSTFAGDGPEPESLEVLRKGTKAATYRLVGAGLDGGSVIAQRAPWARAVIDRALYEQILPRLAVTAPRYYGYSEDAGDFVWLFFEDVGRERFSKTDPAHRALAARWLAAMHSGAVGIAAARSLPDGGPPRYLNHLRVGRETIRAHIANPALPPADATTLHRLAADLDALENAWPRIELACTGMPPTLTHGDIQRKNLYVRNGMSGLEFFVIDWEMAGWGVPAADLPLLDLATYWSVVRPAWPGVRRDDVERIAVVGRIFLQLAAIRWVSPALAHAEALWLIRPMSWLRAVHERLVDAIGTLDART
jgi:aminoglycoside phosphotransferase (APT) family kinase protein